MRTLPLISHHLFVSAVGHDAGMESDPAFSSEPAATAHEVPLEVVDAGKEIPAEGRTRAGFRVQAPLNRR